MPELRRHDSSATVIEQGGRLDTLTVNDLPILFPKTLLLSESGEKKLRGGMHVCVPNFGPDSSGRLAQHGFGRTSKWDVVKNSHHTTRLELHATTPRYTQLVATLEYKLKRVSLSTTLHLTNHGAKPIRVAPAFHPYFALSETETAVKINDVMYELDALAGTEFITAEKIEFVSTGQRLTLSQSHLSTWAIWTDKIGPYICIEPTFGGNRFLESEQSDELLAPGKTQTYSFAIHW